MKLQKLITSIVTTIFVLIIINILPIPTSKGIPEKFKFARWAYVIFWYVGFWGMILIQDLAPNKHNILLTISGLMFFHTSTIFFFAASWFPWGKKLYGYLYGIFVTLWWIAFLFYPQAIKCPASFLGAFVFITTFWHIQK